MYQAYPKKGKRKKRKDNWDSFLPLSKDSQTKKGRSWSAVKSSCDRLWGKCITLRDGERCCLCGSTHRLQNHHIVIRGYKVNIGWFLIENGIRLCFNCHMKGRHSSHFPTQRAYEEKIISYIETKYNLTYEALYYRCRGSKVHLSVIVLEAIETGLKNYIKEHKKTG